MATINPSQEYDIIQTLTFTSAAGTCHIRLFRGSTSAFPGTVYYRAGISGSWTSLSVSSTTTNFPVTSTTMQVAHDWNKSGNNYMTSSFYGQTTNLTEIAISQKAVLSGVMGNNFMSYYANSCTSLTTLDVPDTSGLTSVGNNFMSYYAQRCTSLTTLDVPDTSGLTSVGGSFTASYAQGCTSLTQLTLPAAGWFENNNINWSVPSNRLGILKGVVLNPDDLADWKFLASASGRTLWTNYIQDPDDVILLAPSFNPHISRRRLLV